jgi:threonine dehydratase
MGQSLAVGHPIMIGAFSSIADGLAARQPGDLTFAITQALVSRVLTVPERAIRDAMATVLRTERLLIDPSSATTVAALAEHGHFLPEGPVVAIASGGNVNPALLPEVVAAANSAHEDHPEDLGAA